jgi:CubicO group peptidase (beta-lactamase class C family)
MKTNRFAPVLRNPLSRLWRGALRLTLVIAIFCVFGMPAPAIAQDAPLASDDLESYLDGVMAAHLEGYNIPGAVLVIVQDGEILLSKGYGYADLEARIPADPDTTLFRPGSVSKLFTWTAVMQLVEQGQLDLHTDVNSYLDFTIPPTYPEPITLAHLMTHTPGFEDLGENLFVLDVEKMASLEAYLKGNLPRRVYPPGEVGAYSNYGTALAGYIVERVSGQPFVDYVEEHIFDPLGMTQSTFRQPLPENLADQLARGYGFYQGHYVQGGFEFVSPYPAGGMSATATDMAAFMMAHLQEGRYGDAAILQPETIAEMHSHQYSVDARLHGMTYGFMEKRVNDHDVIHHGGDTFLFHSGFYLVPKESFGLFVSYNGAGGTTARDELLKAVMDRYYPVPSETPSASDPLTPPANAATLAEYTGEYHTARADYSTPAKILRLLEAAQVSATPEGYLTVTKYGRVEPYVQVEANLFRHLLRDELLLFQTDANGTRWLQTDGDAPFAYFQPPWYATLSITMLLFVATLVLLLGSTIGWLIGAINAWRLRTPTSPVARAARWVASVFGVILLMFLIGLASVFGDMDPAYGVPRVFFGDTPTLNVLMWLPILLGVLAILMVIFTLIAWLSLMTKRNAGWNLAGRVYYTLLTTLALAVTSSLLYWNMLALPV